MQTEKSVYKEIEDLLEGMELPRMALVEQRIERRLPPRTSGRR